MPTDRIYPLPAELLWHPKALATAPGPLHRAVLMLALAYWVGGCEELPDEDTALSALMKMPLQHLRPLKGQILAAFATIRAALDKAYEHQAAKHRTNALRGYTTGAKRRAQRICQTARPMMGGVAPSLARRDQDVPAHVIAAQKAPPGGKSTHTHFVD